MQPLKPNAQRARLAISLIWMVMVMELVSIISSYLQYNLLAELAKGENIPQEILEANDTREMVIWVIYLLVYISSAIAFISWFRRAYFNLHQKINYLAHSEGWAAGCWFVPIINLARPYHIMKELYLETPTYLQKNGIAPPISLNTFSIGIWWALWLTTSFVSQIIYRYTKNAQSIEALSFATMADIALSIVGVALAFLVIKIISDYAKVEQLLLQVKEDEPVENTDIISSDSATSDAQSS